MREQGAADSTAFALERRNFDFLPDEQAARWRTDFLRARSRPIPGPEKLIVELLNSCNLDCPMCRVGEHGQDLSRSLPIDLLDRIIVDTPSVRTVRLNGLGESTLLPNFRAYVETIKARGVSVELISNGSAALPLYDLVLGAGGHVLISWDSADPATFEKLRRPARWEDYRKQLQAIGEIAAASASGRLSLIFTLQKANIGGLEQLVELARAVNAGVQVNVAKLPAMSWVDTAWQRIAEDAERAAVAAERLGVPLFVPDQICGRRLVSPAASATAAGRCSAPWQEVVIRWNGDVQACNMFNPYVYGNLHRTPLSSIWQNEFAALFRSKLNSADAHPYCRDCAYIPSAYA